MSYRQQHDVQEPGAFPAESPAHGDKYGLPLAEPDACERAMRNKVLTLPPEATVADAAGLMQIQRHLKGIPLLITPEIWPHHRQYRCDENLRETSGR